MMRPWLLRGWRLWAATVIWAALGQASAPAAGPAPVNVLLLMTDQHHYQALGSSGNPIVKTPHLDNLAAGGTRFSRMYCPVPYCSPTRASIVTGRYPSSLGLGRNIDQSDDPLRLRDPIETYLHRLAAAGYHCHQLGKWHLGDTAEMSCFPDAKQDLQRSGKLYNGRRRAAGDAVFDAGPRPGEILWGDAYLRPEIAAPHEQWHKTLGNGKQRGQDIGIIGRSRVRPQYQLEPALADYCIELLKRHRDEPFAITYSVSPPHPANVAPAPYYDLYDPARLPLPATWADRPAAWANSASARLGRTFGEAGFREYLRCYYAQVTMIDDCIGRILAALDELGLAGHTLVIFTTDHGNLLGQHGMMDKSVATFYEDLVHIPLLLRLPGKIPAGRTCDAVAASIDLAPTILDYAGAAPLAGAHGRSLRPFIQGVPGGDRCVFCEREKLDSPRPPSRMIRTDRWKLCVLGAGDLELYDLLHDPGETRNVAREPGQTAVIRDLARALRTHMVEVGDQGLAKLESRLAQLVAGQ
jgi:arylsulfatase A-like enzyme